ncbi:MAG: DUF1501 domain-containing protein, partial [Lentisphaeria bacterium]|nr:DUF1501 domain-containing protein [Lentisphaeria bacterium]
GAAGLAMAGPLGALGAAASTRKASAKAVIEVWLWGGPSHLDTFDPKPDAGEVYCGPLGSVISTNADGVQINAALPQLAKHADKYSIIRSMTHGVNGHETAAYMMQTGRKAGGGLVFPCLGAVVGKMLAFDAGYKGLIPPYIALTSPQGRFSEAGFLGPRYKPFATGGNPNKDPFEVSGVVAKGVTRTCQEERRALLHSLDSLGQALPGHASFATLDRCEKSAYNMILGDAGKVFDLSKEPAKLRDEYGRNTLGQSCLAARRMIEEGVRYVAINCKGWDTHKQHFQSMNRMLPELDNGLAALLRDLDDRGLLDSTVVWCGGEFGRTPKVLWNEPWNGGRGHFGACFSTLVAGGGFKGGQIVGASDATGSEVAERPVYPQDLHASIYELLGIDPDGKLPNSRGLTVPVTIPSPGKGRLREIMA